jgi:hypothetical protein
VNLPPIYSGLARGGNSQPDAVALDRNEGDADVVVNDDLLTDFARQYKQGCPSVLNADEAFYCASDVSAKGH